MFKLKKACKLFWEICVNTGLTMGDLCTHWTDNGTCVHTGLTMGSLCTGDLYIRWTDNGRFIYTLD